MADGSDGYAALRARRDDTTADGTIVPLVLLDTGTSATCCCLVADKLDLAAAPFVHRVIIAPGVGDFHPSLSEVTLLPSESVAPGDEFRGWNLI